MSSHDTPAAGHQLLRTAEICRRLGVSHDTWTRWIAARKAPDRVPNVPGHPRWRLSDIEDFERGLYGAAGARVFFGAARRARRGRGRGDRGAHTGGNEAGGESVQASRASATTRFQTGK